MDLFHRLFNFIGVSLFSGAVVSYVLGGIGNFIFWIIKIIYLPEIYNQDFYRNHLSHYIFDEVFILYVPLGLSISCATGIHHAIFGRDSVRLALWGIISGLGTISGVYFAHFTINIFPVFLLFSTFIGTTVGLVTHWLINKIPDIDEPTWMNTSSSIWKLIIGSSCTFFPVYGHFKFLELASWITFFWN